MPANFCWTQWHGQIRHQFVVLQSLRQHGGLRCWLNSENGTRFFAECASAYAAVSHRQFATWKQSAACISLSRNLSSINFALLETPGRATACPTLVEHHDFFPVPNRTGTACRLMARAWYEVAGEHWVPSLWTLLDCRRKVWCS